MKAKHILLLFMVFLIGCRSTRFVPEVIYLECPTCQDRADPQDNPRLLTVPEEPIAVVELKDGTVLGGSVSFVPGVAARIQSLEYRNTKVSWDAIKRVIFAPPMDALPENWDRIPGAEVWEGTETDKADTVRP